jgi:hypothetical protein
VVDGIKDVISNYQERLMNMAFAPKSSFGQAVLGDDGNANKLFLMYLFLDMDVAFHFLKDTGLIRTQMTCNTCGRDMAWCVRPQRTDGYRWECRRRADTVCNRYKLIRRGSWFQHSHLTLQEVLFLTYDILRRERASRIQEQHILRNYNSSVSLPYISMPSVGADNFLRRTPY